jgi:subtilisin family serine protease
MCILLAQFRPTNLPGQKYDKATSPYLVLEQSHWHPNSSPERTLFYVQNRQIAMEPLALVKLNRLMELSRGKPEIVIGLIDGPVAMNHSNLASGSIRQVPGRASASCILASSVACLHGTFVAGILSARRGSLAPAICPDCTLLLRPIFRETPAANGSMPNATPEELAAAIVEIVRAGARVVNLSAALVQRSTNGERELLQALDFAASRGVITVAAAGNQGTLGGSVITRHRWVVPVAGCDLRGRPLGESNFGSSIGRRGLSAPAESVSSLGADGKLRAFGGTSAAAPFVTGTIALLWSEFPSATAGQVKFAVTQAGGGSRNSVVPPLLDAWAAHQSLAAGQAGG